MCTCIDMIGYLFIYATHAKKHTNIHMRRCTRTGIQQTRLNTVHICKTSFIHLVTHSRAHKRRCSYAHSLHSRVHSHYCLIRDGRAFVTPGFGGAQLNLLSWAGSRDTLPVVRFGGSDAFLASMNAAFFWSLYRTSV